MKELSPLVLVIEDEVPMQRFLRRSLASEGYRHIEAQTGRLGLDLARSHMPSVVLLDLGLPDIDGLALTRALRAWTEVPIVILSARGHEDGKVAALDAGADDYLTKPFGAGELRARIRAALRHASPLPLHGANSFVSGDLRVEFSEQRVFRRDQEVHLSPTEYKLLSALVRNAGRVVTHSELLREVWGPAHTESTPYLRVYMGQLRHKLEREPARPRTLLTEPCVGYRLKLE